VSLDPEQRGRLLAAKLVALIDERRGPGGPRPVVTPLPGGAGARLEGSHGRAERWVLVDAVGGLSFGAALAWATREPVDGITLLVDGAPAGSLARRAQLFDLPVEVLRVDGRALTPAAPSPVSVGDEVPPSALELIDLLVEAGAEVVVEHGTVRGEVRGLEIARVVVADDGARLEVGVGRHDREAFAMVHGNRPTHEALASVIATVAAERVPGRPTHPLNRLAGERWMRRWVIEHPEVVGAVGLEAVASTTDRESLQDRASAVAVGRSLDGGPLVVACSVGADLDLVPAAADARAVHAPEAELVLALPSRDAHAVTRRLAAALHRPARLVDVEEPWRADAPAATDPSRS